MSANFAGQPMISLLPWLLALEVDGMWMWMWLFARLWLATSLTHAVRVVDVPTLDSAGGSWPRYEHLHLSCQSI